MGLTRSYASLLRLVHQLELALPNPPHLTALGHLTCCVLATTEQTPVIASKIDAFAFTPAMIADYLAVYARIEPRSESLFSSFSSPQSTS